MKHIKKFEDIDNDYEETLRKLTQDYNKQEESKWVAKDNIQGLKELFNLVLPEPEVFKIPYSYHNSKNPDFYIYVVSGVRSEKDDHKFVQELYSNHKIINQIYNLEFFNITLSRTKKYATIVLYDYLVDPNAKNRSKSENENYLQKIKESELPLPSNVKDRIKPSMIETSSYTRHLSKGIDYSDGGGSNLALFDWVYEDINVPIKVGDTILGGRFKNKKIVVKKIGKNKKGDITINDKPLLKFRIIKESITQDEIDNGLAYLKDDGFKIIRVLRREGPITYGKYDTIQIFKQKDYSERNSMSNLKEINWTDIESDLLPFIESNREKIKDVLLILPDSRKIGDSTVYDRKEFSIDEIISGKDFGKIFKINIRLN